MDAELVATPVQVVRPLIQLQSQMIRLALLEISSSVTGSEWEGSSTTSLMPASFSSLAAISGQRLNGETALNVR